jgi:hypothetical protein
MHGALHGPPSSTDSSLMKRPHHKSQCLAPIVLAALPDATSQGVTLDEMLCMFNRLEGRIGMQIKMQLCRHPSVLQNVLQQLQADGFVASTQSTLHGACRFWRVFFDGRGEIKIQMIAKSQKKGTLNVRSHTIR